MKKDWNIYGQKVSISGFDDNYFKGIGLYRDQDEAYCRLIDLYTSPTSTILDVGANIGKTVIMAATAKPGASIIAFEPGAKNFAKLNTNIADNKIPNVKTVFAAISDQNLDAIAFSDNSAWGGILSDAPATKDSPPCIRLDDYIQEHSQNIRWMKIDVEGHEMEVIRGAEKLIKLHNPIVHMEFNITVMVLKNQRVMDFVQYLSQHFMFCYRLNLDKAAMTFGLEALDLRTSGGKWHLVHDNILKRAGLEDILLSNEPLT